jgi:hypothetical protein
VSVESRCIGEKCLSMGVDRQSRERADDTHSSALLSISLPVPLSDPPDGPGVPRPSRPRLDELMPYAWLLACAPPCAYRFVLVAPMLLDWPMLLLVLLPLLPLKSPPNWASAVLANKRRLASELEPATRTKTRPHQHPGLPCDARDNQTARRPLAHLRCWTGRNSRRPG